MHVTLSGALTVFSTFAHDVFGRYAAALAAVWGWIWLRFGARYRSRHWRALVSISSRSDSEAGSYRVDCIVVPVGRPFSQHLPGLELAVELAREQGAKLLVICSQAARAKEFPAELIRRLPDDDVICVDLDRVDPGWWPAPEALRVDTLDISKLHRGGNDVGRKRNAGISLGVAAGWKHILFLDDDVFAHPKQPTLTSDSLSDAVRTLARKPWLKALGWTSENFNDNSVVGHARKFVDLDQGVFLGSGALLARCDIHTPFFPAIYNEDWLFMLALAMKSRRPRRSLGRVGAVGQLEYDPFVVLRAKREEAGDVLAEGMLNLFEDYGKKFLRRSTEEFWRRTIQSRRDMIIEMRPIARKSPLSEAPTIAKRNRVDCALGAALGVNKKLHGSQMEEFVRLWTGDLETWRAFLAGSPSEGKRLHAAVALKRFAVGEPPSWPVATGSINVPAPRAVATVAG